MTKYRVLIVDDEPLQTKIFQHYCNQIGLFSLIAVAHDAAQALQEMSQQSFDLLLLDINMPVLSGTQLARVVPPQTKVVFVTAYAEYAVEAFDLQALDYLLKPVAFERFVQAVQKFTMAKQPSSVDSTLLLRQANLVFKVKTSEIMYCEAKGNFTRVFLSNKTEVDTYITLSQLMEQLPAQGFLRTHRSFVVNLAYVTAFEKTALHLNDILVPVGNSYKKNVEDLYY